MNIFIRFYAYLQYRDAVRKAEKAYAKNNRRYYVMPNAKGKVKLIVTDRNNFRRLRQKHYISQGIKMVDVKRYCFFYTGVKVNTDEISESEMNVRLNRYFAWYDARRQRARQLRKQKRRAYIRRLLHIKRVKGA